VVPPPALCPGGHEPACTSTRRQPWDPPWYICLRNIAARESHGDQSPHDGSVQRVSVSGACLLHPAHLRPSSLGGELLPSSSSPSQSQLCSSPPRPCASLLRLASLPARPSGAARLAARLSPGRPAAAVAAPLVEAAAAAAAAAAAVVVAAPPQPPHPATVHRRTRRRRHSCAP